MVRPSASRTEDLQAVMDIGRRIYAAMDRLDDLMARELGVNRSDLRCLYHLNHRGASTPSEIAAATGLTSGAVTALLDRLERQGLIGRRQDCSDRRSVTIIIPDARGSVIEAAKARLEAAILGEFEALEAGELALVASALPLFGQVLERAGDRLTRG
jgi:DNA-binding MarR family transcriptional regulator